MLPRRYSMIPRRYRGTYFGGTAVIPRYYCGAITTSLLLLQRYRGNAVVLIQATAVLPRHHCCYYGTTVALQQSHGGTIVVLLQHPVARTLPPPPTNPPTQCLHTNYRSIHFSLLELFPAKSSLTGANALVP